MKKWYQNFDHILTPEECMVIVNNSKKLQNQDATTGYGGNNGVHPEIRKSNIAWLPRSEPTLDWLYKRIDTMVHKANRDTFNFDLAGYESLQFTEYGPGQFYNWHQDNCFLQTDKSPLMDRKLSVCIQLSHPTGYDGGEFWVNPSQPLHVQEFKDVGDAIVFPSFLWHQVKPVTSGIRHSLVTWVEGPRFR
jgi:PKHD-type hydroxylase